MMLTNYDIALLQASTLSRRPSGHMGHQDASRDAGKGGVP